MHKFRMRETVEAVQWFPGVTVEGATIRQFADGEGALIDGPFVSSGTIDAGDWIVRHSHGWISSQDDASFREEYEDIGG